MDITIGRPYIERGSSDSRLCSDIRFGDRSFKLWFSLTGLPGGCLLTERCDAFAGVLLPEAMKRGLSITSETPISASLLYQFREHLIPTMSMAFDGFQEISIDIPSVHDYEYVPHASASSCPYSLNDKVSFADFYIISRFGKYKDRETFEKVCSDCESRETLYAFIDSNIDELFPESDPHTEYLRLLSSVLILQKVIGSFSFHRELIPFSGGWDSTFNVNREEWFAILATGSFRTEQTVFYLDPGESFKAGPAPEKSSRDILIGKPFILRSDGKTRLKAYVKIDRVVKPVWFEVSDEYGDYLADDRLDPFVIAFLPKAMREGRNIVCQAPVSKRLLYQIRRFLIPACSSNMDSYKFVEIFADKIADIKENAGAVTTGCTCGVDSMYTIEKLLKTDIDGHRLTHLMVANCGTLESDDNSKTLKMMASRIEDGIGKDTGIPVVCIDTNLDQVLPEEVYVSVVVYRLVASVVSLQKLFGVFCLSSSIEYVNFSYTAEVCEYYEPFLLKCFDLARTRFHSSGAQLTRIEKLSYLADSGNARKHLHPCIYARRSTNCGTCGKCLPTITALYALGKLDGFGEVFDLDDFHKNTDTYIGRTIAENKHEYCGECYVLLKEKGLITKRAEQIGAMISAARTVAEKHRDELLKQPGEEDS